MTVIDMHPSQPAQSIDIKPRDTDPQPDPVPPFIAIGIPSGDMVDTDFMMSIAAQAGTFRGITAMISSKGCYVDKGRMECVRGAKQKMVKLPDGREIKPTHLMFFDSDMTFPNNTIQRLMSHDKDIVGCIYSRRVASTDGKFHNIGITEDESITQVDTREQAPLIPMKLLPTGILLIKMTVFDTLPEFDDDGPIFGYKWMPDLKEYEREDVRFCRIAREHGLKVWCDPWLSVQIGHIGQAVYRVDEQSKRETTPHGIGATRGEAPAAAE